ncbi:MAG TPA: hypothetical protein VFK30_08745, partial [Anaerolineae bacterium]|nr:hypothetical protein [Anaerolineae bacterium]
MPAFEHVDLRTFIASRGVKKTRQLDLTRDLIAKEGVLSLHSFVRLGWPQIEPARPFVDGWHLGVFAEHLEAISSGQLNRIIFNVPPGTMKSLMCSV